MADALAAAERRKTLLSVESTPPPRPKKRELQKRSEGLASASTTASSSGEKVTPDPKAIRTDPEPRVLFGGGISASSVLIAQPIFKTSMDTQEKCPRHFPGKRLHGYIRL